MRLRNFLRQLDEAMLAEATKYDPMFAEIIRLVPNRAASINATINWARQALGREDRIVWFLRWFRLFDTKALLDSLEGQKTPEWVQLTETITAIYRKYLKQMMKMRGSQGMDINRLRYGDTRRLQGALSHTLSLPVPAIRNFQFGMQTPDELLNELGQLEEQWKKEQELKAQFIQPQEGDQILIDFGDGWAWWLLNRGACDAEATAMGHCGNVPSERQGDRILSLRKQGPMGWRPSLTFILNADGKLGEMKGRGNDKPVPEYHPYIIRLLEHPIIQGIRGGGYMPEHNFSLKDLPEAEQDRLAELKPGLASGSYILKKFGPTDEFAHKIIEEIQGMTEGYVDAPKWDSQNQIFIIEQFKDPDAFVNEYGTDFLQRVSKMFNGGESFWDDMSGGAGDGEDLYRQMPSEILAKIGIYAHNNYGDNEDYEDVDWQDSREVWDVLTSEDDDIINAFKWAEETGYRYGAEADCWDDFQKVLSDPWSNTESGDDVDFLSMRYTMHTDEKGKEHITWDGPCWMILTPQDAARVVDESGRLEEIADQGWSLGEKVNIDEPYNGWSGYDEAAALEDARERLYEYIT